MMQMRASHRGFPGRMNMFTDYLRQMSSLYDNMDSVIITDKDGVVEYSAAPDENGVVQENFTYVGKKILEIYPELTPETSTIMRVLQTGEPIEEELQEVTDLNGKTVRHSVSTYPIGLEGKIIGVIEGSLMVSVEGKPVSRGIRRREESGARSQGLYDLRDIITVDPNMIRIKEKILRAADGDSPVMIIGETGTGKELVAQAIHVNSPRADAPFVSQNCSAIPMGLLESTLFGTVKGSYTGAVDRRGLFELAEGGTLFLDELNSMEKGMQGKILKAVEEQQIRRVGDEKVRKCNVRIVSALNVDPPVIIDAGEFRRDLYYRLGVVQIRLPLLQERKGDIPVLLDHFIRIFNQRRTKPIRGYSELAQKVLLNYSWPGNVRDLRNAVDYGFNMCKGDILTLRDVPDEILYDGGTKVRRISPAGESYPALAEGQSLTEAVELYEKRVIEGVCRRAGNITEAARSLGISRQSLRYKLNKYGIDL